ncbi:MAG: tRNA pseudouridine(38-40) synthase TruA [Alphaproteobacteria bacterium]
MTARYKLTIEYDGGPFVGWQRQDNGPSVQAALERAVHGFRGQTVTVQGAGRTDAGVHALGQVAHMDLERGAPPDTVRDALNAHLRPDPVAVLCAEDVAPDFHARFDAVQRHYLYRIATRRAPLTLTAGQAWAVHRELDVDAMHGAAQVLTGRHDFTTFRAAQCQADSPVRTIDRLTVSQVGDEIHVTVSARSFLHNQVRSMVGSLKLVGDGKWRARDLEQALKSADRTACGPVAPAHGLYLTRVDY